MRGSALDVLYMSIFITVIPLVFVICHFVLGTMSGTILNTDGYITYGQQALEVFNEMFPLIYFVMGVGAIALASRISAHPVFIGFAIIVYAMLGLFISQISNIYQIIEDEGSLASSFAYFSNVTTIHDNIVIISLIFLFLIGIAMYSKGGVKISE